MQNKTILLNNTTMSKRPLILGLLLIALFCSCTPNYENKAAKYLTSLPSSSQGFYPKKYNNGQTVFFLNDSNLYSYDLKQEKQSIILSDVEKLLAIKEDGFYYCSVNEDYDEPMRTVYWFSYDKQEPEVIIKQEYGEEIFTLIPMEDRAYLELCSNYYFSHGSAMPMEIDDYQMFVYDSRESSSIEFKDAQGNDVNWKKKYESSSMGVHDVNVYFTFVDKSGVKSIFTIFPHANKQRAKEVLKGNLIEDYDSGYFLVKKDEQTYDVYDHVGNLYSSRPTAKGYVSKNGILKNDVISILENYIGQDVVFYFRTKNDGIVDYKVLSSYNAVTRKNADYEIFNHNGNDYKITVRSAKNSKDNESIMVIASDLNDSYLLRMEKKNPFPYMYLVASGSGVVDLGSVYRVDGRNGESQFYNLNGDEISDVRAGAEIIGLDAFDLLDLL